MLITVDSNAIVHILNKLPSSQVRISARNKFKEITCKAIDDEIFRNKEVLREMRSESESVKRSVYAEISKLETVKLGLLEKRYGF